ncbi:hypothetical protein Tdes44962_MAKER09645 [Teratosphaeria destructans]|uniref:Uncharacterized protein n=1 Tax=Teratosphaeria destructans TaxID=418781 RepID=A0A9W7W2C9_9PEZI|nr:hypothetical protein Tdes44962_MAKER09645 [Teratosphaeria destructans]
MVFRSQLFLYQMNALSFWHRRKLLASVYKRPLVSDLDLHLNIHSDIHPRSNRVSTSFSDTDQYSALYSNQYDLSAAYNRDYGQAYAFGLTGCSVRAYACRSTMDTMSRCCRDRNHQWISRDLDSSRDLRLDLSADGLRYLYGHD